MKITTVREGSGSMKGLTHTASIDSMMKLGKLKKNLERSKIVSVVRSFWAFEALSRIGRKI
jgi:hypothetical protein